MLDPRVAPKLQTPERQPIHARILAAGLDDEATYVAELLLAMTDGDTIRISNWVAGELFELAISEWRAAVAALAAANAVLAVLASYRSALAQQSAISNQQSPTNNPPFVPPDTAAPPPNPSPAPLPLDLSSLAPDELDQVVTVQSGAKPWRTLPKPLRVKVASLTLRQLARAKGERITQEEWDTQRPPWLPSAGSLTYMYSQKWHEIPQE